MLKLTKCLVATAVALCCAASITTGHAGAQTPSTSEEDPELQRLAVAYYTQKYAVDLEEAQRRLAIQDRAGGIDDDLTRLLGDQYAGIWYDHYDRGRLKIGLTRRATVHVEAVRGIVERYGLAGDADLVAVQYSLLELERKQNALRHAISEMVESAHALTSYNAFLNKVVITALSKLSVDEEKRLKGLSAIPGVHIRRVEAATLASEPISCNITYCNPPLRGGREIDSNKGDICTLAFIARDRINPNQLWALTAGHCIYFSGATTWSARNEANAVKVFGNTAYFTYADTSGSGGDAGIVSIDAGTYWAVPAPIAAVVVKASDQTTRDPSYAIRATSFSSLGQILCRTGRTTGTECGEVSNLGADETEYIGGVFFYLRNMGELDVCAAQGGDSGSPLYKRSRAYGILSGVHSAAGCFETYQGVRGAENLMGVDVLLTP